MATGLVTALLGAVFPLVVIGLVIVFVVKRIVPWLIRGHANAPAQITQRHVDPTSIAAPPSETFDTITWDDFELLIGEIFRRQGYAVEISSGLGADGGKDLLLRKNGELAVVQCKKLARDSRITATQMRDFFGLITAEGAAKGFFITTGYFSADAKRFATGKPIELLERSDVEQAITQMSAPGENLYQISSWIDTFASRAHVVEPICPFCEHPMKLRRGALGKLFWGCSTFPRCRGKRDGRDELLQAVQWMRG